MEALVKQLQALTGDVNFIEGGTFCWSPATSTISYKIPKQGTKVASWSLLHETGHAMLGHRDYASDIDLLMLEVAAWQKAKEVGSTLGISIDENHIQDCIDTYRDWLHQRSTCPRCGLVSLQANAKQYQCHNCSCSWYVTAARFCRPYRLTKSHAKRPLTEPTAQLATFL